MTRRAYFFIVILLAGAAAVWFVLRPRPAPRGMTLEAVRFQTLPGWRESDPQKALAAFRRSCTTLEKQPVSRAMGGAGYAGTVGDWLAVCRAASLAQQARAFFEKNFTAFAISFSGKREGLFTGYYEPELRASRTRHGPYQTPVYGRPSDLIDVDLGQFRDALKGERISGRVEGSRLVPYADRAAIVAHGLPTAPVLFYAEDPVAVFFLHIQGSGRVVFDDGTMARVRYAAQNGQPYTAIGRTLISRGALTKENISMPAIRAWLKAHPQEVRAVLDTNRSYIFFSLTPLGDPQSGSTGTEGVPLTAGASLAVDNRIHPLGAPFFVATTLPDGKPLYRLAVAQDTGGAIRGAVRGDIYWGAGPRAEKLAGGMKSKGELYVLLPKSLADQLAPMKTFASAVP